VWRDRIRRGGRQNAYATLCANHVRGEGVASAASNTPPKVPFHKSRRSPSYAICAVGVETVLAMRLLELFKEEPKAQGGSGLLADSRANQWPLDLPLVRFSEYAANTWTLADACQGGFCRRL
jgi:hypothetical protein